MLSELVMKEIESLEMAEEGEDSAQRVSVEGDILEFLISRILLRGPKVGSHLFAKIWKVLPKFRIKDDTGEMYFKHLHEKTTKVRVYAALRRLIKRNLVHHSRSNGGEILPAADWEKDIFKLVI